MPIDLFAQQSGAQSLQPQQPVDLFQAHGVVSQGNDLMAQQGQQMPQAQPAQNAQPQQQSFMDGIVNNPIMKAFRGANDAIGNIYSMGLRNPQPEPGAAYGIGHFAGDVGGFLAGGEILDTARLASEALPVVGKYAQMLGEQGMGAARRVLGAGVYGADTNADDRLKGAEKGATIAGAVEAVPGAVDLGAKLINNIQPKKYASQLMDMLSGGQSQEESAQSLASTLKNSYEQEAKTGHGLYNNIFDSVGSGSIYDGVNQKAVRLPVDNFKNLGEVTDYVNDATGKNLESVADLKDHLLQEHGYTFNSNADLLKFFNSFPSLVNSGAYSSVGRDVLNHYDYKLNQLHDIFSSNPSLQNAHNLQSQLGFGIRKLQATDAKSGLDVVGRSALQAYHEAQGAVQSDISDFLNSQDESLAKGYEAANKNWLENVVPYKENPKIAQIATGNITNPRNISNIFASPEPEIQKVVDDLGPEAQRRILYAELGKTQNKFTPEKLLDSFNSLENKGLSSYVNPSLQQQFDTLAGRIRNRDTTQKVAGGLLGASVFGHGGSPMGAGMGALVSGAISPAIMRYLQSRLPIDQISGAISKAAPAIYRPASTAILANAIPGRPQ